MPTTSAPSIWEGHGFSRAESIGAQRLPLCRRLVLRCLHGKCCLRRQRPARLPHLQRRNHPLHLCRDQRHRGVRQRHPRHRIIYGPQGKLAKIAGSTTTYYGLDHLSKRFTTDTGGSFVSAEAHYPWGETWYGATNQKEQFTTYVRDAESANDYATFRSYTPRIGRFFTPDPYDGSMDLSDPQSMNRYVYVLSDPINLIDPLGLAPDLDCQDRYIIHLNVVTGRVVGYDYLGRYCRIVREGKTVEERVPSVQSPQTTACVQREIDYQSRKLSEYEQGQKWRMLGAMGAGAGLGALRGSAVGWPGTIIGGVTGAGAAIITQGFKEIGTQWFNANFTIPSALHTGGQNNCAVNILVNKR